MVHGNRPGKLTRGHSNPRRRNYTVGCITNYDSMVNKIFRDLPPPKEAVRHQLRGAFPMVPERRGAGCGRWRVVIGNISGKASGDPNGIATEYGQWTERTWREQRWQNKKPLPARQS